MDKETHLAKLQEAIEAAKEEKAYATLEILIELKREAMRARNTLQASA